MGTIGTHSINPAVYAKINYDPIKDFEPVIQFGTAPNVLVVHPSLPIKSVSDLIAYIKANPGKVNYGSSGNGTSNHLSGAMFVGSLVAGRRVVTRAGAGWLLAAGDDVRRADQLHLEAEGRQDQGVSHDSFSSPDGGSRRRRGAGAPG